MRMNNIFKPATHDEVITRREKAITDGIIKISKSFESGIIFSPYIPRFTYVKDDVDEDVNHIKIRNVV